LHSGEITDFSLLLDVGVMAVTSLLFVIVAGALFERKK